MSISSVPDPGVRFRDSQPWLTTRARRRNRDCGRYTTERQPSQVPAQHPQPAPCARHCSGCWGCRRSCPLSAVACRWCIGGVFLPDGSHEAGERICGLGRSARRRCVWVSARTGGGSLDGRPGPWPSRAERRQLQRSRAARRLGPPAGWRLQRWCWLRPQFGPGPLRRGRRPGGSRQCPAAWRARGGHGYPARGHRRCLR